MSNFLRNGRKIVAIGRNYVDHAKELGNAVPKGESELAMSHRAEVGIAFLTFGQRRV